MPCTSIPVIDFNFKYLSFKRNRGDTFKLVEVQLGRTNNHLNRGRSVSQSYTFLLLTFHNLGMYNCLVKYFKV